MTALYQPQKTRSQTLRVFLYSNFSVFADPDYWNRPKLKNVST